MVNATTVGKESSVSATKSIFVELWEDAVIRSFLHEIRHHAKWELLILTVFGSKKKSK